MLIEAALAAFAVGLLLGGSFKKLADINLRFLPLLVVSIVFSILPRVPLAGPALAGCGTAAAFALCIIRYGALIIFVAVNRKNAGIILVGIGGALNAAVMLANSGTMPVSVYAAAMTSVKNRILLESGGILNYSVAGAATRFPFLCDRIVLRGIFTYSLSAGDIVIAIGIFIFILVKMKPRRPSCLFHAADKFAK